MREFPGQNRLTNTERFLASAIGGFCVAGGIWLTWVPPTRTVAIDGCIPSTSSACTTSVDGDVTALATVVLALAGIASLVALLGVRFTNVKVGGVEVSALEKLDQKTQGLDPVSAARRADWISSVNTTSAAAAQAVDASDRVAAPAVRIAEVDPATRAARRQAIYVAHRGVFLSHLLAPATKRGQRYEVFVFLVRHKGGLDRSEIRSADFFFGPQWDSQVFPGQWTRDGQLGVVTEAYGEFLVVCELEFADGTRVVLDHYVDFSMAELLV